MGDNKDSHSIRVAIAGLGNCASSLIEGLHYYRQNPESQIGLLFPSLGGYSVGDLEVVLAFDISARKVGQQVCESIYAEPNNFVRIPDLLISNHSPAAAVLRGPTLDGNPEHLARFVPESPLAPVDVAAALKGEQVDVLVNLLPTGSIAATEFYAQEALKAGCAFVNCIPTVLAQRPDIQEQFARRQLVILGDDVKSQVGTTILHRALLQMLQDRGADLQKTSQVNIGGNSDFANFVYRAETKLVSKRKSLKRYLDGAESHVGHHYDPTKGPLKNAYIEIDARVFGNSPLKISVKLESDDKPNSAGSVVDLARLAKAGMDRGMAGVIPEACAYYMKSPPIEMEDRQALELVGRNWAGG